MTQEKTYTTSMPDSMQNALKAVQRLRETGYKIVYNRIDGLFVFNRHGDYVQKTWTSYWNSDQKNKTKYYQDKYNIASRHYSEYQLICYCLVFGTYDKVTKDYSITGVEYKGDNKDNGQSTHIHEPEQTHDKL